MAVKYSDIMDLQENIFSVEDQLFALQGAFAALLLSLKEAGALPVEKFSTHMSMAATELEEGGLKESAAALDVLRSHLINCLLNDAAPGCTCKK